MRWRAGQMRDPRLAQTREDRGHFAPGHLALVEQVAVLMIAQHDQAAALAAQHRLAHQAIGIGVQQGTQTCLVLRWLAPARAVAAAARPLALRDFAREFPIAPVNQQRPQALHNPQAMLTKARNAHIADLKTTQRVKPEDFSKTTHNFGYHRQAALYLDVVKGLGMTGPMHFIAVSKQPPHECVVFHLGFNSLNLGRSENKGILFELAFRRRANEWGGRHSGVSNEIEVPHYAFPRN